MNGFAERYEFAMVRSGGGSMCAVRLLQQRKMLGLPLERVAEFQGLVHEFMAPHSSTIDANLRSAKSQMR